MTNSGYTDLTMQRLNRGLDRCWASFYDAYLQDKDFGEVTQGHVEDLCFGRSLERVFETTGAQLEDPKNTVEFMELLTRIAKLFPPGDNYPVFAFGSDFLVQLLPARLRTTLFESKQLTLGYDALDGLLSLDGFVATKLLDDPNLRILLDAEETYSDRKIQLVFAYLGDYLHAHETYLLDI